MKRNNKKGFTLAELLIVVAIIAVLVAVAIPVFTAQLEKSKLATATANMRGAVAEYMTSELANQATPTLDGAVSACNALDAKLIFDYKAKASGTDAIEVSGTGGTNIIPFGLSNS